MGSHKSTKNFACNPCDNIYPTGSALHTHRTAHLMERQFKCSLCGKLFATAQSLGGHMKSHNADRSNRLKTFSCSENNFACTICNYSFISLALLEKHKELHRTIRGPCTNSLRRKAKKFSCGCCEKTFDTYQSLGGHMTWHNNNKLFPCNRCDSVFTNQQTLAARLNTHSDRRIFKCYICREVFPSPQSLGGHIGSHKRSAANIALRFNGATSATGKKVHPEKNVQLFSCHICNKQFSTGQMLGGHMRTHQKLLDKMVTNPLEDFPQCEKNFKCDLCNERFSSYQSLGGHMSTNHTGLKPHRCQICGLLFGQKNLEFFRHLQSHAVQSEGSCESVKESTATSENDCLPASDVGMSGSDKHVDVEFNIQNSNLLDEEHTKSIENDPNSKCFDVFLQQCKPHPNSDSINDNSHMINSIQNSHFSEYADTSPEGIKLDPMIEGTVQVQDLPLPQNL